MQVSRRPSSEINSNKTLDEKTENFDDYVSEEEIDTIYSSNLKRKRYENSSLEIPLLILSFLFLFFNLILIITF